MVDFFSRYGRQISLYARSYNIAVYGFDGNNYVGFIPDQSTNALKTLEPGRGYWILATNAVTWIL
jgi:hypothetical protein